MPPLPPFDDSQPTTTGSDTSWLAPTTSFTVRARRQGLTYARAIEEMAERTRLVEEDITRREDPRVPPVDEQEAVPLPELPEDDVDEDELDLDADSDVVEIEGVRVRNGFSAGMSFSNDNIFTMPTPRVRGGHMDRHERETLNRPRDEDGKSEKDFVLDVTEENDDTKQDKVPA